MSAQVDAAVDDVNTESASSFIFFGKIAHPITPGHLNRARIFQHCKANSYSQATRPINTKATPNHTSSEQTSSPRFPKIVLPVNTKPAPTSRDTWTAVSNWLATSQTFEKPREPVEESPTPASLEEPAPWKRLYQEHWFQISKSLDLRLKARSEQFKAPVDSGSGPGYAHRSTNGRICNHLLDSSELARTEKHTLRDGTRAFSNPVAQGLPPQEGRENDRSLEPLHTSRLQEKPERHTRTQESLSAVSMNETHAATPKQAQVDVSKKTLEASAVQAEDEQLTIRNMNEEIKAKAKELTADAMATDKKEWERKQYVEERARDIHENLLLCKPFDIDAARREFSEEELRDVKRVVRELGFVVKK